MCGLVLEKAASPRVQVRSSYLPSPMSDHPTSIEPDDNIPRGRGRVRTMIMTKKVPVPWSQGLSLATTRSESIHHSTPVINRGQTTPGEGYKAEGKPR